jgi:hypothetical protein
MRSPTPILTGAAMLVAVLLTGCGAEAGPTAETAPGLAAERHEAEHSSITYPLDDSIVNPCNGEKIHVTGYVLEQINVVDVGGGELHFEMHDVVHETGTGVATGASYRLHDVTQEGFNSPSGAARNLTYTFRDKYHVMSKTPGLSFTGQFFLHVVVLPSGELKVTRELGSVECPR